MVTSVVWNDSANMLAAFQDGVFTVWCYPEAVLVDQEIVTKTLITKDSRCVFYLGLVNLCLLQNVVVQNLGNLSSGSSCYQTTG